MITNTHCRCRICNAVSSQDIATSAGDFTSTRFVEEDDGLGFLCYYCAKEVDESLVEFEDDEEEFE